MKRFTAFAAAVTAAVCMTACSVKGGENGSVSNGLGGGYQTSVAVTLGDLNADGTVKRFGDGLWEVEFTSPNTLAGIKLSFSDGITEAEYKGLSFSVPQSALPVKAMMLNLIEAVDGHSKADELKGEDNNGDIEISGRLEGGDYTLIVDKNGTLKGFSMPNNELNMTFTENVPISAETTEGSVEQTSAEETSAAETTASEASGKE